MAPQRSYLPESEGYYRLLMENATDMISLQEPDGRFKYVSPSCEFLLGYEPEELIGRGIHELYHPEDIPSLESRDKSVLLRSDAPVTVSYRIRHKFDYYIWFETISRSIFFPGSRKVKEIISVSRDITDRKKTEELLAKSEERFRDVTEAAGEYIWEVDVQGKYIFITNRMNEILGYEAEEILGHTPFDFMPPQDARRVGAFFANIVKKGTSFSHLEHRSICKNGQIIWQQVTGKPIKDAKKTIIGFRGTGLDITLRKKAEEERNLFFSISLDMLCIAGLDGYFKQLNPSWAEVLGWSSEELYEKPIIEFVHPRDRESTSAVLCSLIEGEKVVTYENRCRCKDGSYRWISWRSNILAERSLVFSAARDISGQKQFEVSLRKERERAERANEAKSSFLANMSHEIRTPMNAILGFSDLLLKTPLQEKQKQYLTALKNSGKSLLTLINDILDLSKIEAGKMSIQYRPVSVKDLFHEAVQVFEIRAGEKNLRFSLEIDNNVPPLLRLDEVRIRQILFNLIGNAVKFTDQGGVTVSLHTNGGEGVTDLLFSVKDTGIGIDEKAKPLIFDSFTQQENQDCKKYGGTGLGLAITKRLVEIMNGSITVESTPGKGSVFTVVLKNVKVEEGTGEDTLSAEEGEENCICPPSFSGSAVLIVDDVESNRMLLAEIIKETDCEIYEAANGLEALKRIEKRPPDLVFLDLRMPVMDGYQLAEKVRSRKALKDLPLILLTASVSGDAVDTRRKELFNDVLVKPIKPDGIYRVMGEYLRGKDSSPGSGQAGESFSPEKEEQRKNDLLTPEKAAEVLKVLRGPLEEMRKRALKEKDFSLINNFAKEVLSRGERLGVSAMVEYGDTLKKYTENFDIENIVKKLEEFHLLPEKVEKKVQ